MSQLTDPRILELAASDETAWDGFTDDTVILQRPCPDCDKGLLYAPARFCKKCGGDGLLTRTVPRPVDSCGSALTGLGAPDICDQPYGHDGWHVGRRGSAWADSAGTTPVPPEDRS